MVTIATVITYVFSEYSSQGSAESLVKVPFSVLFNGDTESYSDTDRRNWEGGVSNLVTSSVSNLVTSSVSNLVPSSVSNLVTSSVSNYKLSN